MGKVTLYYNCHLLRNHKLIKDDLWVQDGKIADPKTVNHTCDDSVDCEGSIISPGFIDLKINGAFGHDFSSSKNCKEAVDQVAKQLPQTGVTSFCPTIVTVPADWYQKNLPHIRRRNGDAATGAGMLGVHMDGPFISREKPGAHDISNIRDFANGFETVKEVYGDLENVSLVTLAPELPNASEVIKNLTRWGIKISLGHSASGLVQAEEGVAAGACMITHLFNAMPSFHHRDPGLVGLLATDLPAGHSVYFSLIADGNHTHPAALRMAYKISPSYMYLVSDGVAAFGLGNGEYEFTGKTVVVEGEVPACKIKGTDTLYGSVAPLDLCIRNLMQHTACGIVYALNTATLHPALAMGITDRKGTLDFGTDADFVLLNPETITVNATYIGGNLAYEKSSV